MYDTCPVRASWLIASSEAAVELQPTDLKLNMFEGSPYL